MVVEQKRDILQEVRNQIAAGNFTKEKAREMRNVLIAPGITVHDYLKTTGDFGEILLIDGVYRRAELEGQRSSEEITRKVLELKSKLHELTEKDTPGGDPELITILTQLHTIQWFQGKVEDL